MRAKKTVLVIASALVIVGLAFLVHEARKVPSNAGSRERGKVETNPLTDVAGHSKPILRRRPRAGRGEPPKHDVNEKGQAVARPAKYVLPPDLPNPAEPPTGTKPRVIPGKPTPPDPFTAPKIEQDPHRGGR